MCSKDRYIAIERHLVDAYYASSRPGIFTEFSSNKMGVLIPFEIICGLKDL